jgi:hypothetical protein
MGALLDYADRYHGQLAMTIVSQSKGYAVRSGTLSGRAEADTIGKFIREHLKIPATVGLVVDSVWQLPAYDGRKFDIDTSLYGKVGAELVGDRPGLGKESFEVTLFYDGHGDLRFVGKLNDPRLPLIIAHDMSLSRASAARGRQ